MVSPFGRSGQSIVGADQGSRRRRGDGFAAARAGAGASTPGWRRAAGGSVRGSTTAPRAAGSVVGVPGRSVGAELLRWRRPLAVVGLVGVIALGSQSDPQPALHGLGLVVSLGLAA